METLNSKEECVNNPLDELSGECSLGKQPYQGHMVTDLVCVCVQVTDCCSARARNGLVTDVC